MDANPVTRCRLPALLIAVSVSLGCCCLSGADELSRQWEYEMRGALPQTPLVDERGKVLYVAEKHRGLGIYQLADNQHPPQERARVPKRLLSGLDVMDVTQEGTTLFVALGDFFSPFGDHAGVAMIDVETATKPIVKATWKSPARGKGSAVIRTDGKWVYLGAMTEGIKVLRVSPQQNALEFTATFQPDPHFPRKNPGRVQHPNARGMWIEGATLYLAYDAGGLRALDMSRPEKPHEIGRYINLRMGKKQQAYNAVWVHGGLAYVAVDYAGLEILDLRDPANITQVGWWNPWSAEGSANVWFNSPGHTNQLYFDAARALVYLSAGDCELLTVDVSDPRKPQLVSRYGGEKDERGAWGLTATRDSIILTYVTSQVPFRGRWAGLLQVDR